MSNGSAGLLREGGWIAAGQAAGAAAMLVGTRLLTDVLPPAVFGTVGLLIGLMAFGRNLVCAPLLQALLRFHPEAVRAGGLGSLRRAVAGDLRRAAGLVALVLVAGGALAGSAFGIALGPFLMLGGLLIADAARSLELNILNAARRQRAFALWGAAEAWARPVLAVLAIGALGPTPFAVLLGYLAASATSWAAMRLGTRAEDGPGPETASLRQEIRKYALPLSGLALAGWVSSLGDRYLIAGWLGAHEVGLYAAAYGLVSLPFLMAQSVIESSLRPVYFDAVAAGDRGRERRVFRGWAWATAAVCAAGFGVVTIAHQPLAALALGEGYRAASPLMPWIAGGYALLAMAYVFEKPCLARKRTGSVLLIQTAGAAACLAALPVLVHLRGLQGAAEAVPVYFGVQLAVAIAAARAARTGARAAEALGPMTGPAEPRTRPRSLARGAITAAVAVVFFLVALEGGLRVYHRIKFWRAQRALPPLHERCLVPTSDRELIYELNPGWSDAEFSVNSHGMADREVSETRPPHTFRIGFVGDSISCGFRIIPRRDLYMNRLQELLASRAGPGPDFECLNFGVNGYGGLQELHLARTRVRRFDPQVIVAQLCLNDPYPTETDYADLAPSHALRTYDFLFRRLDPAGFWAHRFVTRTWDEQGVRNLREAIQGFAELGRHGPPVLGVLFPYLHAPAYTSRGFGAYHAEFRRAAEAAGLPLLDLYDRFSTLGLIDDRWPKDPVHPDASGHLVAAEAILQDLERRGLLPGPAAR